MWFGTQNGLTRYDGVNFVIYENEPDDTNSLSYNNVSCICETKNKNLWVGTFSGLNLYDREKNNFTRIKAFQNTVISSISIDHDSNIWIGTIGNRIIKYNPVSKKTEYFNNTQTDINSLNGNHITCTVIDKKNRLWIGSWDGLCLMNTKGKIIHNFRAKPDDPQSLSGNYVNTLSIEKDNVLWIGTLYTGLNRLLINGKKFKFRHYFDKNDSTPPSILCTYADNQNNLWIGMENDGLIRLNTKSGEFSHYMSEEGNRYALSSNLIRAVYKDDLNILWVGTIGRGVNFMDERNNRFETFRENPYSKNTLCGKSVRCFTQDKQGNIWIATYHGICKFDIKTKQFTRVLSQGKGGLTTNAVNSMVFDADGNLWVGTLDKGIDRFNKNLVKTGNFKIKGIEKVGDNKINTLYVDKENTLWVGTSGSGLFRYDKPKGSFVLTYDESQGVGPTDIGYVFSILETSDSNLWVGTAYRLFCIKDSGDNKYSFRIFSSSNSHGGIHSNHITTLFEDHNKNLWVGSLDHGLFRYNKKDGSFTSFTKQDGLPSNTIDGILEDNTGNLWLSTGHGLSKFNISAKTFRNFTRDDGLIANEFIDNSCLKSKNGMFFYGCNEGFNCFYPEKIKDDSITQPVRLTDFKLFNRSARAGREGSPLEKNISQTKKIVLKYNQSTFTIDFVALNYIHGSKSQYAYILQGLESKWNIVRNKNSATYSYVKPGSYLFKVKGSNNDGVWNNVPATLKIVILPPFWKSDWALVMYFLFCIASVYAIIHFRVTRAKEIHLAELNQLKLQFFANISHELRTPLSLILPPVENLFAYARKHREIKDQLETVYKNSYRLFRLVNEIMDFQKSEESKLSIYVQKGDIVKFTRELSNFFRDEALRRQITYSFESEYPVIEAWFDRDKYEKIILNLLSNAFKFTPDHSTISIRIEKIDHDKIDLIDNKFIPKATSRELLKISVANNGKEISPADISNIFERFYQGDNNDYAYPTGTGIGLYLTKTLVELHHGKIFATSEKGKETCFTILMPLGNSHFKKSEIITEPMDISTKINESRLAIDESEGKKTRAPKNAPSVLLVEDNYELRKYILSAFSAKYKVIEAGNGKTGYKLAVEHVPDLIISDIIMPVLSGIELCKQIKGNILTSHIPVILLTAKISLEDKINGVETGADAYITKPFNVRYLEVVTNNLIETRKNLFKRFSQEVYILPKEVTNNHLDQNLLEKIIDYVENNIGKPELSVEDLASYLLMSPGHTWRKVKSLTGLTTNELIRTIKLKKAIKIMEDSNLTISEIAYQVGFSSPAYFTKCFRNQYGKSPSSFLSKKNKN